MKYQNAIAVIAIYLTLSPLYGCGGGKTSPLHSDYLSSIDPVRWNQPEVLYRVSGGLSDSRRAVRRGFGRWDDTIRGHFRLREAQDGEKEHITARFARLAPVSSFFGYGRFERVLPVSHGGIMESAVVEFDHQLAFQFGQLERLAAHAMGHCLFAQGKQTGGHSPYPTDLMFSSPGVARPSPADGKTFLLTQGGID